MDEAPLEKVFPTGSGVKDEVLENRLFTRRTRFMCAAIRSAAPNVFIPVFPGTNCEYDSTKAFERAGAKVVTKVFKQLNCRRHPGVRGGVQRRNREGADRHVPGRLLRRRRAGGFCKVLCDGVPQCRILKEELTKLLNERDGLMLGICNGFQALIKLGLVPERRHHGAEARTLRR